MSTYVIGDLQGCYDELVGLLDKIEFNTEQDVLWLAGDLINRGPKNLETITLLMSLNHVVCVLGNHDLHFLAVANGCQRINRKDTFSDILESPNAPEIAEWLRFQPLAHFDEDLETLMVHAGVPPGWSLNHVLNRAAEVENELRSSDFKTFLRNMYSNEPCRWDEQQVGVDRVRTITNYLTRMRYCDENGGIELKHKANKEPAGFSPWFQFPNQVFPTYRLVFGHWAALGGVFQEKLVGIDTGCVWGRQLSAYRLDDAALFHVDAQS